MPPDNVLIVIVGAAVTLLTPYLTARAIREQKKEEREQDRLDKEQDRTQDRADRLEVAELVAKVAIDVRKSNAATSAQLTNIADTSDATHAIVNNQRTVMLRALAVAQRVIANDHPDDPTAVKAAEDAERDLAENMRTSNDPDTKLSLPRAGS